MPVKTPLDSLRWQLALIGLSAFGLVATGLGLAHTLNLAACPLCILQRMLYFALAMAAFMAGLAVPHRKTSRLLIAFMAMIAATGVYTAGYQTWLQRFAIDTSCAANQPWWERFVYWAGEKAPWFFEATGMCSEAGWKLLGLSIAEWSLIAFSLFTLVAIGLLRQELLRVRATT